MSELTQEQEQALQYLRERARMNHLAECPAFQAPHLKREPGRCRCGRGDQRVLVELVEEQGREIERLRALASDVRDGLARGALGEHATEPCPCSLHSLLEEMNALR